MLCVPARLTPGARRAGPQRSPSSAGEPCETSGLAQLTLHPEGKELLRGARWVLGHTHVAGSVSHLCCGNLWAQGGVPGTCHRPDGSWPPPQELL